MPLPRVLHALLLAVAVPIPGSAQAAEGPAQEPADSPILGAPAGLDARAADDGGELIVLEPGTRLYGRPDVRSAAVAMIDARIELPLLERRGHWVQVRYGSFKGWVARELEAPDPRSAARSEHAAWRLALAREMLGSTRREGAAAPLRLGPFALHTDVDDRRLLDFLSRIASHLPEAYEERYGLAPRPSPDDTVVIFAREDDYRAYEERARPESDRGALGHAAYGLAVLYAGRQGPEDVAAILVHELTHLLSHGLVASPPPWLDEGMANDLAFCRIDGARRLELGSLGGRSVVIEKHSYRPGGWIGVDRAVHLSGPAATRSLLAERWRSGDALRIELVTALSAGEFFDPEGREGRYDASAFFVRYLLDGEDGELAAGLRSFLAALAAGEPGEPQPHHLPSHLGRAWPRLEAGFASWLEADAR